MQITRGKRARAQRVVIYGPEGIGKSSFAAQFPEPLFIDTE
ncbi:phage protein [Streptococcus pyogenes]|nr:phage protein [Streptococcus pyogenes]VGT59948.1 phage protein [Streptococcus pyogenes]VGU45069.1 phage protein [Streptococcus pyogenes]